jgi:glutathione peroxidase
MNITVNPIKYKRSMKNLIAVILFSAVILPAVAQSAAGTSIYSFTVKSIDGKSFSLKELQGKKIMIVNTASKCGFTPQYEQLESLYKEFGGEKFVIIGFPANNFMAQEPGTNSEIQEFCTSKFGVTFPMMAKISVKGEDMDPLYKWLTDKKLNGVSDSEVKWNFQKFLIDESGHLVSVIPPKESPLSDQIIKWLKE